MELQDPKPKFSSIMKGRDFSLSGPALVEILRTVLQKGAPVRFQVKGFSMSPFIKNEDVVTVAPLRGRRPGLGDIIAFVHTETGRLCIHRIVRRKAQSYVTQGDNRSETTECVPGENLLGTVTRVERGGRLVLLGLGPERFLIAFLCSRGLLFPLLLPLWKIIRPIIKRAVD